MRGPFSLVIVRTGRDHFKLYLEGYADADLAPAGDLLLRYAAIAAQPAEGFRSLEAAHEGFLDLLGEARRRRYAREEAAARRQPGAPIPERRVLRSSHLVRRLRRLPRGVQEGSRVHR